MDPASEAASEVVRLRAIKSLPPSAPGCILSAACTSDHGSDWHRRTAKLRGLVIRKPGKLPVLGKAKKERLVEDILEIASELLIRRFAKKAFKKVRVDRSLRFIGGHGWPDRWTRLRDWARHRLNGPIVYAFWSGKRCLYVGKGKSWRRLYSYKKSHYLWEADSIEVFHIGARSQLSRAECLATHLFRPRDNQCKPAKVKWGRSCPVCKHHDRVRRELRGLLKTH